MKFATNICRGAGAVALTAFAAMPAWAQTAAAAAPTVDKGDTAWMLTSTVLVLMMILPGLALFYGGLTRAKNMLSTMTQIGTVTAICMIIWVCWGYSMAFGDGGNGFIASFSKAFLHRVNSKTTTANFTKGVGIPEYVFICFQMTFAAITVALVLGSVVERMKFSATVVFSIIWLTIVYFPIAHMVWGGNGIFFSMGALDFAAGTVVHVDSGVSALVACLILGKRVGYPHEPMPPHSLTLTTVGTGLLWVGWVGFNARSALEAHGSAGAAEINNLFPPPPGGGPLGIVGGPGGRKTPAGGFSARRRVGGGGGAPPAGGRGGGGGAVLGGP